MATYTELIIEQYSDFSKTINVRDSQGDYLNLSGYYANSQIRKSYHSTTYTTMNAYISNVSTGEITLTLTAANTANLDPGRQQFDVIITSTSNSITRIIEGPAIVTPGITHG